MDNQILYWSPSVRWEKKNKEIQIEVFSYNGDTVKLFPDFYFISQKGTTISKLEEHFSFYDSNKLKLLVKDFIKKKILVNTILSPNEIFHPQGYLFKNEHLDNIKYDAKALDEFKIKQLNRKVQLQDNNDILLEDHGEYPEVIENRISYRTFDTKTPISFKKFSKLLSVFKQKKSDYPIRYYYASAGGLYPIDIYLYIKDNRVENISEGLYYYNPVNNSIQLVNDNCNIPKEAHFKTNQEIFQESAISVFMVYNADTTIPKYGGMGYFYACIDCGIMVSTLTFVAELYNIGICSIGDLLFNKVKKNFLFNHNQVLIHTIELGLKPGQS